MDVYITEPKLLNETAFSVFASEGGVISPRKPQTSHQELKQKYSVLGNTVLSTENSGKAASDMDVVEQGRNQPPRRIKIPMQFLEERRERENVSKAEARVIPSHMNGHSSESQAKGLIGNRQSYATSSTGRDKVASRANAYQNDCNGKLEVNAELNRPASKLIQDNQNLQKLFDSVRGKETQMEQPKKVGKVKLPATFQSNSQNKYMERQSEKDFGKYGKNAGNERSMSNAVAMTFDEWKNEKLDDKDETTNYKKSEVSLNGDSEGSGNYSIANGDSALESEASSEKMNANIKNYWHGKQQTMNNTTIKTGNKDNNAMTNKTNVNNANLATSRYGGLNDMHGQKGFKANSTNTDVDRCNAVDGTAGMEKKVMSDGGPTSGASNIDKREETNKTRTIGKLQMPNAFSRAKDMSSVTAPEKKNLVVKRGETLNKNQNWIRNDTEEERRAAEDEKGKSIKDENKIYERSSIAGKENTDEKDGDEFACLVNGKNRIACSQNENGEAIQADEHKPVGKLNLKSIFHERNEEKKNEKKEEESVIAKHKAIFDNNVKKGHKKHKGVGKLRVGSAKSERYEEIDNLAPEGQVPSNISDHMKEQLERILQGRSESTSSQASSSSSSSKKNEGREVGRLSLSSISSLEASLGSSRTNGDVSVRSLEDDAFSTSVSDERWENDSEKKVNNGSLESQLGNIFQRRSAGGSSASSSVTSSLNASFNAGEEEKVKTQSNGNKEEADKTERRKMITDAIKERYSSTADAEKESMEEQSKIDVTVKPADETSTCGVQKEDETDAKLVKTSIVTNNERETPVRRGKVSIPNIFSNKNEAGDKKAIVLGKNDMKRGMGSQKNNTIPSTDITTCANLNESNRMVKSTEKEAVKNSDDQGVLSTPANCKEKPSENHTAKTVNFREEIGVICEDGEADNKPIRQNPAGKLSSSLMQSFESGNIALRRPATPRQNVNSKSAEIVAGDGKEIKSTTPTAVENVAELSQIKENVGGDRNENNILDARGTAEESRKPEKRVIGKLSIPSMFK